VSDGDKRLLARFQEKFDNGLINVKFFVMPAEKAPSTEELEDEISRMLDTAAEIGTKRIESIDTHLEQKRFDAAF
jgi:hypothetical protein